MGVDTSHAPSLGVGTLLPQTNCDSVSKEGGDSHQPTMSEQMFLFTRKESISHFKIYVNWIVSIFFSLIPPVLFIFFFFKICSVTCSADFYSVPISLELHVLVNFRVRSSQLPSTTKAGWLTAGNTLNAGKTSESWEFHM